MYKIGDFARLAGVSVRLLRHYDEIDLIKPACVDAESNYRYYTVEQLTHLTHVLALKDLGFSLAEIRMMGKVSGQEIERLLVAKRVDLMQRIAAEQDTLEKVEKRLSLVRGGVAECDVLTKTVPAMTVLSLRQVVSPPNGIRDLFREVLRFVPRHVDSTMSLYYNLYLRLLHGTVLKGQHVEVLFLYSDEILPTKPIPLGGGGVLGVRHIPTHEVAYTIHRGADSVRHLAFQTLLRWMDAHHYHVAAPLREVYLCRRPVDQNHVTEVQVPFVRTEEAVQSFSEHYQWER